MFRIPTALWALLGVLAAGSAPQAGHRTDPAVPPGRGQLVGAWRLVAVEYRDAQGKTQDPFYQPNSGGLIIYDKSGWMSVQIEAPGRPAAQIPDVRVPPPADEDSASKSAAFDSYYAYFGTWDYDAAASQVIHHVRGSLIGAESGMNYAQTVTFEHGRLIFTGRSGRPGAETVRRKIWEKLPPGQFSGARR